MLNSKQWDALNAIASYAEMKLVTEKDNFRIQDLKRKLEKVNHYLITCDIKEEDDDLEFETAEEARYEYEREKDW